MTGHTMAGTAVAAPAPVRPDQPHPYWTQERVARALGTGPSGPAPFGGVSTDTRTLRRGDLFVALRGAQHDAHAFLAVARDAGAGALVVSDPAAAVGLGLPVYVVPDTLAALGALAAAWRRAWGGPVVAVAGSNGKTSTKELLRAALSRTFDVHATAGNLNNLVGVPLTLLALPSHAEVAVVEVGTNAPGEVARLAAIVGADIAVLTSIGEEHLEGLGDLAGVLREECDVFAGATLAVLPPGLDEAAALASARVPTVLRAGLEAGDVRADAWGLDAEGRAWVEMDGTRLAVPLRGAHQAANLMLAVAAARACGAPLADVAAGLRAMPVPAMRGTWEALGSATLINDAYNANPPSMRAAFDLLDRVGGARQRVLVLGPMRELGARSEAMHLDVARAALASRADVVAGFGEFAHALRDAARGSTRVVAVDAFDDLWPALRSRLAPDAVILLKGSRGARLERLVPFLTAWATP
jgi:UDP-N-acetylmuramoyl-tripeptide--D-alanyl-D-alanine ligase